MTLLNGNYKVFISFKSTDEYGKPTWDKIMGEKLQKTLEMRGIKTFFSPTSVKEETSYDYQEAIYKALEEADILVVMCSNADYLKSGWIKEEIYTFRQDLLNENKDPYTSGIYVLRQEHVQDSEFSLAMRRSQMYTDLDTMADVIVRRCTGREILEQNFESQTEIPYANNSVTDRAASALQKRAGLNPEVGDVLADRYKIESILGKGGMGAVYAVRDLHLNKEYALKCMCNDYGLSFQQQIVKEAEILKGVDNPHVPHVYDVCNIDETNIAIVMSLVKGTSLNDNVRDGIALSEDQVIDIAMQLCDILDLIHSCSPKIIHRDIKPGNLIMQDDGSIVLIDFGSARLYKENQSVDTVLVGTRGYASPEQYGGLGQTDERTDIFSFGMTLLALIMGQAPNKMEIDMNRVYDVVKPKSETLACIIERCTELDSGNRYQSAKEILWNLENPEQIIRQPRKVYVQQEKKYNVHVTPDNMNITAALLSDNSEPFKIPAQPPFEPESLDGLIERTASPLVAPKPLIIPGPITESTVENYTTEMIGKICVSNAQLRDGMMYVHVYLAQKEQALLLSKIVRDHLDYELISDVGLLEMKSKKAVTVGATSKKILFDGPKTEININGIMYFCFQSKYPIEDIDKAKIKINISTGADEIIQSVIRLESIKRRKKKQH